MSSRAYRRMLKDDFQTEENIPSSDDDSELQTKHQNKFLSLIDSDDEHSKEDSDQFENEKSICCKSVQTQKSSKKKRKSKSRVGAEMEKTVDYVRILDDAIATKCRLEDSENQTAVQTNNGAECDLCVNSRDLNPDVELCRLFGTQAIAGADASVGDVSNLSASSRSRRRISRRGGHVPATGDRRGEKNNQRRGYCRSYFLIPHRPFISHGKLLSSGISMRHLDESELTLDQKEVGKRHCSDLRYFTFEHSESYQRVHHLFLQAILAYDHNSIPALLNRYPFHVESMTQLIDIHRLAAAASEGADVDALAPVVNLIESALIVLESAFHPLFSFATGQCRLDYRRQTNRVIFGLLFRYIWILTRRACHGTAFGIAKCLLLLDVDTDPLASLLAIDFCALKAEQYDWLVAFYERHQACDAEIGGRPGKRCLDWLPNWVFSYALALHCLQQHNGKSGKTATVVDDEKVEAAFETALVRFPGLVLNLMDKCGVDVDNRVAMSNHFLVSQNKARDGLKVLYQIYVSRCAQMWRRGGTCLLSRIASSCHRLLDKLQTVDVSENDEIKNSTHIWQTRAQAMYVVLPRKILRHVMLSTDLNNHDQLTVLALQCAKASEEAPKWLSIDPAPPSDSLDTYTLDETWISSVRGFSNWRNHVQNGLLQQFQVPIDDNWVRLFFRSLLPSFGMNGGEVSDESDERSHNSSTERGVRLAENNPAILGLLERGRQAIQDLFLMEEIDEEAGRAGGSRAASANIVHRSYSSSTTDEDVDVD